MSAVPFGLVEDLELERLAAAELEREATEAWAAGAFRRAVVANLDARRSLERVAELERELARCTP